MICETCQGTGYQLNLSAEPCVICMGSGISYCCDAAGSNQPNVTHVNSDPLSLAIFEAP
jgi:DnaJ-class molecular chaperone